MYYAKKQNTKQTIGKSICSLQRKKQKEKEGVHYITYTVHFSDYTTILWGWKGTSKINRSIGHGHLYNIYFLDIRYNNIGIYLYSLWFCIELTWRNGWVRVWDQPIIIFHQILFKVLWTQKTTSSGPPLLVSIRCQKLTPSFFNQEKAEGFVIFAIFAIL